MDINLGEYKNKIVFLPLGGTNEIGVNLALYYLDDTGEEENAGKWIMVDCGSGFADSDLPGVDMIVADISFIQKIKDDLLAIIITHAHEDHIGGIQYLWNQLEVPIYATQFTTNFLKSRLEFYDFFERMEFHEIEVGKKFQVGPFEIETTCLTHSAPEMQGLMIRTSAGNIFHTGDWKFDPEPIVGDASDHDTLKKFGDEGILALVCDSTNVFQSEDSGSEGELKKSITEIIKNCKKMVVVTTFASNLARLDTLIRAGQATGRKVVLCGRSMGRMMQAAVSSGYLTDIEPVLEETEIPNYPREQLLIIATGCQGEPMAATSRIANDTHKTIKLQEGDSVIFSSKIIPGNEKRIFALFNTFVKAGIDVVTERDHFVHVSGHPGREDLKKMYELLRPAVAVPVHGEAVHLHEHAKLAREIGIKHAIEVENGAVVALDEQAKIVDKVNSGYMAVEGNSLLPATSPIFRMRTRMSQSGVAVINICTNKSGRLLCRPNISVPGLLDPFQDKQIINSMKSEITKIFNHSGGDDGRLSYDKIETKVRSIVRRKLKGVINKSPPVIVNMERAFGSSQQS